MEKKVGGQYTALRVSPHPHFMRLSKNALVGILMAGVAMVTIGTMIASGSFGIQESGATGVAASCPEPDSPERQACLGKAVLALVEPHGPTEAINTLKMLLADGTMHGNGDYHDFVHRIGRATAKKGGLNPDAFFLCPLDFNYGCQHGFFEQALVEEPDAKKAAEMICDESKMDGKPLKFLFYCYHGVGHGVLMAKAYDLQASLDLCNEFPGDNQKTGCYQGVFMENVVGYLNGTARSGLFSETDRLAPCNQVAEQYQSQCYINLGGYLAGVAGQGPGAVERATQPCLAAGPFHIHECLRSVGLTSTNEAWQPTLTPVFTDDLILNAVSICEHFPPGFENDCIISGIDNIAQFDRGDTTRMIQFCSNVKDGYKPLCFRQIGWTVKNELPAGATHDDVCGNVPEEYRSICNQGFAS